MPIDNYEIAKNLSDRLEATVPFPVKAKKSFLKTVRDKGYQATADTHFSVDWLKYSGDLGGITCGLFPPDSAMDAKERFVVSITQLELDPEHPLLAEVEAYQQRRSQAIRLLEQGGFAAEMMTEAPPARRKSNKGFGK
jgi:hypothetical protein